MNLVGKGIEWNLKILFGCYKIKERKIMERKIMEWNEM